MLLMAGLICTRLTYLCFCIDVHVKYVSLVQPLNERSEIQCFEHSDVIELHNGVMLFSTWGRHISIAVCNNTWFYASRVMQL